MMKFKIKSVVQSGWRRARRKKAKPIHGLRREQEIILPYFEVVRIHGGKAEVTVEQRERSSLRLIGWGNKPWPFQYSCRDSILDIQILTAPASRQFFKLAISSSLINCLWLEGPSFIRSRNTLVSEVFEVHHHGDGEIQLSLSSNKVETNCQGLGLLSLQGKTNYWRDSSGLLAQVNALGLLVTVG